MRPLKRKIKTISKVKSWHVFCAWTLPLQPRFLFFCPLHGHLLQRQEPVLFHLLPCQQLQLLLARIPTQVLRAFGDFSNGLVGPLSALVEDASIFGLESSLTAVWVPCVVGKKPRMFLVIALFSRFVWTLAVVTTLLLYKFNFPEFLQKRTISSSSLRQTPPGYHLKKPTPPPTVQVLMSAWISAQILPPMHWSPFPLLRWQRFLLLYYTLTTDRHLLNPLRLPLLPTTSAVELFKTLRGLANCPPPLFTQQQRW